MNLLHIDSSILGANSVSRALSAAVVARLRELHSGLEVQYRDLAAAPIAHLSGAYLAGQNADVKHDQALQEDLTLGGAALAEFLAADQVVLGVPMYNFTIPSQLKSWVDRVLIAGKTFRYTAGGPEGLAGGKHVVLALSSGGFYGPGSPSAPFQHQESYLRAVFTFMGVTRIDVIHAEGVAVGPEQRQKSLDAALDQAAHLGAS